MPSRYVTLLNCAPIGQAQDGGYTSDLRLNGRPENGVDPSRDNRYHQTSDQASLTLAMLCVVRTASRAAVKHPEDGAIEFANLVLYMFPTVP